MILSPLNYVGNKSKILHILISLFPKNIDKFVDIFCGSAITALNSDAKNLVLNDNNKALISLLSFLKNNNVDFILNEVQNTIKKFNLTDSKSKPKGFYEIRKNEGLSRHNKEAFLSLRKSYNQNKSEIKLFVLILFAFNHFFRFNSHNFYNVPVGKSDFNNFQVSKTINYIKALQDKNTQILNLDFRDNTLYTNGDFFYFDPPYLITQAPYNSQWNVKDEKDLYEILDCLNLKNKKFALSNVLQSNGKSNDLLKMWSKKYKTIPIQREYLSANYQRKNLGKTQEVLIINYELKNEI